MKSLGLFVVLLLLIALVSCSDEVDFDTPPEIVYGEEICEECGMIISEARFASAYMTQDGDVRNFDDAGDMIQHHLSKGEDVAVFWLHDFDSAEWIRSESAVLLASEEVQTPMGHGIVSFSSPDRARAYIELLESSEEATLRGWDEMVEAFRDGAVHLDHDENGRHVLR